MFSLSEGLLATSPLCALLAREEEGRAERANGLLGGTACGARVFTPGGLPQRQDQAATERIAKGHPRGTLAEERSGWNETRSGGFGTEYRNLWD